MMEEKTFTISLTRTNKLLSRLKSKFAELTASKNKYSKSPEIKSPIKEVNILTYNHKYVSDALENIRNYYIEYVEINNLIEKIKMRLFAANAQYGVHEILASINSLKAEKKLYTFILSEIDKTQTVSIDTATCLASTLKNDNTSTFRISALSYDDVYNRIQEIDTEISSLDELKDRKNISSSITFVFNNDELKYLHL